MILATLWYLSGVLIVIHETLHRHDFYPKDLLISLLFGLAGPLWLVATYRRLQKRNFLLLRRYPK